MARNLSSLVAAVCNRCLYLLRNRNPVRYSRDELRYANFSFGQFGEDQSVVWWMDRLGRAAGTYVDVGAFHPIHLSNTLLLHKLGWRGVNVDMVRSRVDLFDRLRPADYNYCGAVSDAESEVSLDLRGGPTDRISVGPPRDLSPGPATVRTRTLNAILDGCPFPVRPIDYLNVDCEGHDLAVLRSLDLDKYTPLVITIESFSKTSTTEIIGYLCDRGYVLVEKIHWTLLFVRADDAAGGEKVRARGLPPLARADGPR